jgi:glycosyltransferase involved in cell wall biosynthesis
VQAEPHILHVFSSAGVYGAEHAVLGLIPALSALGIDSTIACIDNPHLSEQPLYEYARSLGISVVRIPCSGRLDHATTRALRVQVQQHPRTLMHVHGYKGAFYALRARRAFPGVPIVSTLHGWVTNTRALWLYRLLELWMLRRIQRVCIVAESMRQPLHEAGVPAERIALVENGIDTTRFIPGGPVLSRDKLGIPSDAFVFGGMMRLSPEKNPLGLLEAFSHIRSKAPQAWLVLAGDGPQRPEVEQWLRASSAADRVCLLGARNDPERIYPLFDCFVLPSLTEGLPLALLEAMACERSVVASRVGQVATVLDGLPAHLVPAADVTALEAAMLQALDTHPQPVAAMRQRVEARYSVARMAREYAQLYRELENRNGRLAA